MPRKSTREEFIKKAKIIHPEYDYSKVLYINNRTKVIIICPIHGEYLIKPNGLLSGKGCAFCAGNVKYNTNSFIEKAKLIFPDYDYSKVVYKTNRDKVIITCKEHGDFLITPNSLLGKHGCAKCAYKKISKLKTHTTEEFIKKAKEVFAEYDYSEVDYLSKSSKITVICPIHGRFKISPNNLLSGHGCTFCGNGRKGSFIKSNTVDFINKAKSIFPQYDYSKVDYQGKAEKVKIICPKHGTFYKRPNDLLNLHGCKKCGQEYLHELFSFSSDEFIEKAKMIHPEYDYSKVRYFNNRTKVTIICKKHGEFEISPDSLLRGRGCAVCNNSIGELFIKNWLDNHNIFYEAQKKFENLTLKYKLSYDFYIPEKRLLIEFNGEQHYRLVPRFHKKGVYDLRKQFLRDMLKKNYAAENNYKLISIEWNELRNIDEILSEFFS